MLKLLFIITCIFCPSLLFSQEKETVFTLCDDGKTFPYYYPDLEYKGGFWDIKQHFQSGYPTSQFRVLENNTGIITLQFNVNCTGQIGNFSIQQCDLDYQPTILDSNVTNYFLIKMKTLSNWIPAKDKEGNTVNSHKFFSFRVNEGVLTEILPK